MTNTLIDQVDTMNVSLAKPGPIVLNKLDKLNPLQMESGRLSIARVSQREKEVILLIAQGYTIKQIGCALNICATTVISHRKNLMLKLECKNCPELVYKAFQYGLLKLLKNED